MGNLETRAADVQRRAADQSGLALSGAVPPRRTWAHCGRMGHLAGRAEGQVLPAHGDRTHDPERGARELAPLFGRGGSRIEVDMRFRNLFRRAALEREMDSEMRFHIDMEAAELERMGVDPTEARRRALATFGGVQRFKEEGRDVRAGSWVDDLIRDLRYSLRSLLRSPGYAIVVVLTLALGIAANTSIFSVANGILFKPLPYRDPARLMVLWDGLDWIGVPEAWVTGPEFLLLRREAKNFEGFSAVRTGAVAIGGDGTADPQQLRFTRTSSNFFQLLGTGPFLGRGFAPGEDVPGVAPVAVLSHKLWRQRFGGDPAIVGRTIRLDGQEHSVIGVLPADFNFAAQSSLGSPAGADIYLPLQMHLDSMPAGNHSIGVLARVRKDVPVAQGLAELDAISRRLDAEQYGKDGFRFKPVLLQERMVRDVRPALIVLL